jgi:hypothetical protein
VDQRAKLVEVLRYQPVRIDRPWGVATKRGAGIDATSYLFEMTNGLCANAVLARALGCPDNAPVTLILNDRGKKEAAAQIATHMNQGEQVLAVDLLFIGDAWQKIPASAYAQTIHGLGERSLGLMAAQLIEIARWMEQRSGVGQLRIESTGLRSQTAALVASAVQPGLFSEITVREGIRSLQYVLDTPVEFSQAPELFCLDLLKYFDLDRLEAIAQGTKVSQSQ